MATLLKQGSRYSLQFYHAERSPQRKRFSLQTTEKRTAQTLKSKFERDYLLGTFDPWLDDPWTYDRKEAGVQPHTLKEALEHLKEIRGREGASPNTIRTYRGVVGRLMKKVGEDVLLDRTARYRPVHPSRRPLSYHPPQALPHAPCLLVVLPETRALRAPFEEITEPEKPDKLPKTDHPTVERRLACLPSWYAGSRIVASNSCHNGHPPRPNHS